MTTTQSEGLGAIDRLVATAECERLMYQYAHRLDNGLGYTAAELFTEDGEWTSPTIRSSGRDGLRAYFARRDAMTERVTRHVVTNIDITIDSADRAHARSVAIEFRSVRGTDDLATEMSPALVGDYVDEFHRVDGTWFFHKRHVDIAFKRAGEEFLQPAGDGREQA